VKHPKIHINQVNKDQILKAAREKQQITLKVIIDKYDPIAIYFIVLGSNLYTLFVFPV